jgi:hypothetical protein
MHTSTNEVNGHMTNVVHKTKKKKKTRARLTHPTRKRKCKRKKGGQRNKKNDSSTSGI